MSQAPWPFEGNRTLLWWSPRRNKFILGDGLQYVAILPEEVSQRETICSPLDEELDDPKCYDERLPEDDYAELSRVGVAGCQFLTRAEYEVRGAEADDCLMHLAMEYGLDHAFAVRPPAVSELLWVNGKTVHWAGRSVKARAVITAMTAHPRQSHLYYGTNQGDLWRLDEKGNHCKICEVPPPLKVIVFHTDEELALVAGMGRLLLLDLSAPVARELCACDTAVRSLRLLPNQETVVVNRGMQGLALYSLVGGQLLEKAGHRPDFAIDRVEVSRDGGCLLAVTQGKKIAGFRLG